MSHPSETEDSCALLCFTVTRSSILGHRPVGMGGEGKCKHVQTTPVSRFSVNALLKFFPQNCKKKKKVHTDMKISAVKSGRAISEILNETT